MQIFIYNNLNYYIKINLHIINKILTFISSMIDIETGSLKSAKGILQPALYFFIYK
jgi:hypothetical protein